MIEELTNLGIKLEVFLPFVKAIIIAVVGLIAVKSVVKAVDPVLKKTKLEPMLHTFIIHTIQVLIWVVVILAVLSSLGIDSTSVVTVLAACGAAVALALQGSLSNLAGGIIVMVTHPFSSGDVIMISDQEGTVQSIDIFYTTILTGDNRLVQIPNGTISNSILTNNTSSGIRRIDIQIGVSYNTDIDMARNVCLETMKSIDTVLTTKEPLCVVWDYADSSIVLLMRCFCDSKKYWDTKFAIQNAIKPAFDKAGIEIPFPQMDVHLDK